MTIDLHSLDAHETPSDEMRATWKSYYRADHTQFVNHPDIDELPTPENLGEFKSAGHIPSDKVKTAFQHVEGDDWEADRVVNDAPLYFHPLLPGLFSVLNSPCRVRD